MPTPRLAGEVASPSESPAAAPWDLDADIGSVIVLSWNGRVGWPTIEPLLVKYKIGGGPSFYPQLSGPPPGRDASQAPLRMPASCRRLYHPGPPTVTLC